MQNTSLEREVEAVREDLDRNSGAKSDRYEILPLKLEDWPEGMSAYHALRRDRHGRLFFQFIFCDGQLYSPFSVDGLERLLERCLSTPRLRLTPAQVAETVLMLSRPEYGITLVENLEQDLSQANREALERHYELKDLSPQLVELDEDYKLTFWTLHLRRETLKRWVVYIPEVGRVRISEDVALELRQLRDKKEF